jgi:hypothetical protein
VKHQINKMVDWGVFAAPADWEAYSVKAWVTERTNKAAKL